MKPTKAEAAWMKKVEKLLMNPPSDRIGLYTIGDCNMSVYDRQQEAELNSLMDESDLDFCQVVNELDASLGDIRSAAPIHATSG
jgi:hypothetical protein